MNLTAFDFNSQSVRVILIDGDPWFVLTDVLKALDSTVKRTDVQTSIEDTFGEGEVISHPLNTAGGTQSVLLISEAATTFVISRSRTEIGKYMNRWLHKEVLPSIRKTGSYSLKQEQPKLPSRVVAKETAEAIAYIQDVIANNNPRLAQFLIDHAISDLMPTAATLTGTRLRGVVEIAEDLGLPVTMKNRSQLGKFVRARCKHLVVKENRLVNGTVREVCCYPDNDPTVVQTIKNFFT